MITELVVSNFRSLGRDVRLRLGALTALVGPNGSGKSNVAGVFRLVADALAIGLEAAVQERHGINAVRRWSAGRPYSLDIRISVREPSYSGMYQFSLVGDSAADYRAAVTLLSKGTGTKMPPSTW